MAGLGDSDNGLGMAERLTANEGYFAMAVQTTPHTKPDKNTDPAETERDPNQLTVDGAPGVDAEMYSDTQTAQSAGSRNERVMDIQTVKHKTEPFTSAQHGETSKNESKDAPGVTNHTLREESAGQEKVVLGRGEDTADRDSQGNVVRPATTSAEGDLPGRKAEKAETVEVSDMRPIR